MFIHFTLGVFLFALAACAGSKAPVVQVTGVSRQDDDTADRAAIRELVERTYVDAAFRRRDSDLLRDGFAETFVMQVYGDGELSRRSFGEWLDRMKLEEKAPATDVRGEVTVLDITGVAVTKHFHAHGYEGHER